MFMLYPYMLRKMHKFFTSTRRIEDTGQISENTAFIEICPRVETDSAHHVQEINNNVPNTNTQTTPQSNNARKSAERKMSCCTEKVKKIVGFNVGLLFLILGILLVTLWNSLFNAILTKELTLTNSSTTFRMWKETPIPMYLKFHLFNWTNAEEVLGGNWETQPHFEEIGPYVFLEHHSRVNRRWHKNDTITYQQRRTWHFQPHLSKGNLTDKITHLNVIAATMGYFVKDWNKLVKELVNIAINKKEKTLAITKTAGEWMFDGFHDDILSIAKEFKIPGLNFDKFGWFYGRNLSDSYDGTFTMHTGADDLELLGMMEEWNGRQRTKYYDSYCGYVNGTSGELWPPMPGLQEAVIFSPDTCSSLTLSLSSEPYSLLGIEGSRFVGTDVLLDNGTKYPEMACFRPKDLKLRSGVRDVSKCKFNAPAFVSYPHFYLADPWYRENIKGMQPDKEKHTFSISLETTTGVPLNADAKLQINLLLMKIPGLTMFDHVKETMMPMFWFEQTASLTEDLAGQIKLLLVLPSVGTYTGYGLIGLGSLVLLICTYITMKGAWRDSEADQLLPEKAL